jgi:hypothetical protein
MKHLYSGIGRRFFMSNTSRTTTAVRFDLPKGHHEKLRHLSISEHRPASELLVDAVELLLRYHDVPGIPPPPISSRLEDESQDAREVPA